MPIPVDMLGKGWAKPLSVKVLPYLVWCAERGERITYQKLDQYVRHQGWESGGRLTNYGFVAGAIGNALVRTSEETGEDIPPLNAIVVNKHTGVPGKGCDWYLTWYLPPYHPRRNIGINQRRRLGSRCIEDVFAYTRWGRLLQRYGLERIGHAPAIPDDPNEEFELPRRPGQGYGGESAPHRRLVEYVRTHPACVNVGNRFEAGRKEQWLPSGDRIDVLFEDDALVLGVECKSYRSNEDDLKRGVFQCIKYREVYRATELATRNDRRVECYLAVQRYLPQEVERLARRLRVKWFLVHPQGR